MAGLINSDDITTVKARSSIEDVVSEHVTLRRSGARLVGLCPFHDEKSPSFGINPAAGFYHCFGCGEGGDVISFVQKVEALSFSEAVERLAQKLGMELRYEDGSARSGQEGPGRRSRLIEAHRVAQEFYADALLNLPGARSARDFMRARGFDGTVAKHFGVGFAPRGGEARARLAGQGFHRRRARDGGPCRSGSRGLYDRFRGRLVWPIRDITGDTVGFGARRIFDDDRIEAKYLNTSETPIYKKSTVLYGLDLAKKKIAAERTAVVVEGYTDVMACHLAGVETAVATCGTAFGADHIKVLRRIMRDEADLAPARVIFTFDGDAAGQKAAMRAFADDQKWSSQSFVAVEGSGMDPCELRQAEGDPAVLALIEDAVPMFEFAVRTTIKRFDLTTAEGRVRAATAVAPIVAAIRDQSLRPEYTREVAGLLGLEVEQVRSEVSRAGRSPSTPPTTTADATEPPATRQSRARGSPGRSWRCPIPETPSCPPSASCCRCSCSPPGAQGRGHRHAHPRGLLVAGAPRGLRRHPHRPGHDELGRHPRLDGRRHRGGAHARRRARQRARRRHDADADGPAHRAADRPLRRGALRPRAHDRPDPSDRRRAERDAPPRPRRRAVARAHPRARLPAAGAPARARHDQGRAWPDGALRQAAPRSRCRTRRARAVPLDAGERVLAWARDERHGGIRPSRRRTISPSSAPTTRLVWRRPWHEVEAGTWQGDSVAAHGHLGRPWSTLAVARHRAVDDPADAARARAGERRAGRRVPHRRRVARCASSSVRTSARARSSSRSSPAREPGVDDPAVAAEAARATSCARD